MDENLIKKFEILFAKNGIKIKDSTKGTFTKYCKGKVTQDCIDKAKRSGNKKLIKKAVFAENARKWKHQNGGRLMQMYTALLKRNIDPQLAFETARLAKIEDGRPGHYYVFGKRSDNVEKWADQAVDSLTTGRYTNLRNIKTHEQFKQGLKNKKYNPFPIFYKKMDVGRERDKRIVNQYNKQHNIKLITMADNIDNHYMNNMYIPEKNTVVPTIEMPAENKHFTIPVNYAKEGQKLKKK